MMVMRLFSRRWAAVSLPLPVRLSQTTFDSLMTRRESIPLGETLTKPSAAAVPTKKRCCSEMN